MGIKSSFITNYCTQIKFELNQTNLLSVGFQKIQSNTNHHFNSSISQSNTQLYQHYQSKKIYCLFKFNCIHKQASVLSKALEGLQMIKNDHISNVLFSSIHSSSFNIISRINQIKIFTQHSSINLNKLVQSKYSEKQQLKHYINTQYITPYSNIEIANFIRAISGIASEIQNLCLPIQKISPKQFLIMQNQAGKIKFNINFQQLLTQNKKSFQNGYFSSQIWNSQSQTNLSFQNLNQQIWKQKYQLNLIFSLGMITLHFILLQSCQDCFNYKSKQFCKSELENKIQKLSKILQKRVEKKQRQKSLKISSLAQSTGTYIDRLHTQTKNGQEEQFQCILYQTIVKMLFQDKSQRINISELKLQSKKLMDKVRQQYTMIPSQQTFTVSNVRQAHQIPPQISRSISNASSQQQYFNEPKIKKILSDNDMNTTQSVLHRSKSKSMITHLKSKKYSDHQKSMNQQNSIISSINKRNSFNNDKQNIMTNKLQDSNVKILKRSIRKLSGYRKVKISEYSYIEGYFQNDKAHGLGKITRKTGQVIECIFHNNQIIQEILPGQNQNY